MLVIAPTVNSPTFDRLAMSASDLRAKLDAVVGPAAGLAEAMGYPAVASANPPETDSTVLDVLARSVAALDQLGADIDGQTVGVGLAACARIIKAHDRAATGGINLALIAAAASLAPAHLSYGVEHIALDDASEADA